MYKSTHVIIPMAGHSRRFKKVGLEGPKALLPVGNIPMIQHVVEMFSPEDIFHIIVNEEQVKEVPELVSILKSIAISVNVTIIPCHELGPTYSVLQVNNIPYDEPVIISYCDFIVSWNYQLFLRSVEGLDASAPSFRGFHPASFGMTFYAYMKIDGSKMLRLREKQSFTDNRTEEHASTGIYYFKTWELFNKYANKFIKNHNDSNMEAYTSLLLNNLVDDGLNVGVYEVTNFICLGTPEDYYQYQFWWKYFHRKVQNNSQLESSDFRRINLIPMAGSGSRFRKYGYQVAKPLIQVHGQPMVLRAAASMPTADKWIFMPRADDLEKHPIEKALKKFSKNCTIFSVSKTTSGQAATCLLVEDILDNNAELMIASCDYEHFYNENSWSNILNDKSIDGAIWTVRMDMSMVRDPSAFAYCRIDNNSNKVLEVVEKKTISDDPSNDPLVVGTFWFRKSKYFKDAAKEMINEKVTINGEHYIGTSINYLIKNGKKIVIFDVEQWVSFGDPFELRVLEYWDDYFTSICE